MRFTESMKENRDFRRLYRWGKSAAVPAVAVYCKKNKTNDRNRLGITVNVKLGNAVLRNRQRRRIREIYRLNEEKLKTGFDIVIVARHRMIQASFVEVERAILRAFAQLGILRENR